VEVTTVSKKARRAARCPSPGRDQPAQAPPDSLDVDRAERLKVIPAR
jgi:hypothetical protein